MKAKFLVVPLAALVGFTQTACSTAPVMTANGPMPQYCTQNNTATGAIVGALLGAGLGAAIGGNRTGALAGAAGGALLGTAAGAQADAQCRQLAYQRAMEMAAAQEAAARQAAAQAQSQAPAGKVAYQPVEYVTPSDGTHHRVTPLSSRTDPATKQTCRTVQDVTYDTNGNPGVGGTKTVCTGADGKIASGV